jgi:hypothetical protein
MILLPLLRTVLNGSFTELCIQKECVAITTTRFGSMVCVSVAAPFLQQYREWDTGIL